MSILRPSLLEDPAKHEAAKRDVLRALFGLTAEIPEPEPNTLVYFRTREIAGRMILDYSRAVSGTFWTSELEITELLEPYVQDDIVERVQVGYNKGWIDLSIVTGYRTNMERESEIRRILESSVEG